MKSICGARHISITGSLFKLFPPADQYRTYDRASKFVMSGWIQSQRRVIRFFLQEALIVTAGQQNNLQPVLGVKRPGLCMRGEKKTMAAGSI